MPNNRVCVITSVVYCCNDFKEGFKGEWLGIGSEEFGTDVYDTHLFNNSEWNEQPEKFSKKINFCPWCGIKLERPDGK